ncbi:MAG TPA: AraD1 family protein [Tepidisphaeraceae bacterium]|nr:AraD1 family protein [Tepidisphaeraceae bacterium]
MRLVQLSHPTKGRRVALVEEPKLKISRQWKNVFDLATAAIQKNQKITELFGDTDEAIDYDAVYSGKSDWKLLPCFDHPEPSRFYITGTGLTHKASAANRQSMHTSTGPVTDSMKMFNFGLEGGRPAAGAIGAAPEWFYKGTGSIVHACNEPLEVPWHGEDGGEEAEIAGIYLIGAAGEIYRVGMAQGNEFADHVFEAKNYLYLAGSKLRACSIGPELVIDPDFSDCPGKTRIVRDGKTIWEAPLASGEKQMCHSLANLEHHHFKYAGHRTPGDAHLHFFGADNFSFKVRLKLQDGDVMEFEFKGFGRPLRNPLKVERTKPALVHVRPLG